jgi:hypothetical protein
LPLCTLLSLSLSLSPLLSLILAHGCQLFLKLDPVLLQFFREILSHEFCKSLQLLTRYYLFFIFNLIIIILNAGGIMAASAAAAEYSTKVEFLALLLDFIFFGHLLKLMIYQKPKF